MILFRQINNPCPGHWKPGTHTYVEYHDVEDSGKLPLGIAYVSSYQFHDTQPIASLDYVHVLEHHHREGVATKLLVACRQRWPNILVLDPASDSGKAFLKAVNRKGAAWPPSKTPPSGMSVSPVSSPLPFSSSSDTSSGPVEPYPEQTIKISELAREKLSPFPPARVKAPAFNAPPTDF